MCLPKPKRLFFHRLISYFARKKYIYTIFEQYIQFNFRENSLFAGILSVVSNHRYFSKFSMKKNHPLILYFLSPSRRRIIPLKEYLGLLWFSLFLCHINHCGLSNAKSTLYIYIEYILFHLVGIYVISTIVGYLMPNPLYTYISNIYDLIWLEYMPYQPL